MPKPVLASIHGSVAGVGISLMMACDLIIAANTTQLTMAYSHLGISPDGGASFNLPRIVGTKKAMEWLLLSDRFNAESAKEYGLINWVVPEGELSIETQHIIQKLVNGPTQAYAHSKRLLNESWQNSLVIQLAKEADAFEFCTGTKDFKQGVSQFISKKKPEFLGE